MIHVTLYTSPTCMPCHILAPRLKTLANEHSDKMTFFDVDVTKSNPLNITGTPHIVIKKDDEEIFNGHVDNPAAMLNKIRGLVV